MSTAMLNRIKLLKDQVPKVPIVACGKLVRGIGLTLEAVGCQMPVGSQCLIQTMEGEIEAEVVGFAEDHLPNAHRSCKRHSAWLTCATAQS
jgi:flagellum-specific ATP synthase